MPQVQTCTSYSPFSQFKQTARTRGHKHPSAQGLSLDMRARTFSHASSHRSPAKHEKNISSQFQNSELFHARRINVAQSGDQGGEVTPKTWGNEVKHRERYKVSSSPVCQSHPPQNTVHWEMILIKRPSSHDLVIYQDIRVVFSFEHRPGWHCTCSHRIPLSHYPLGHGHFYGRPHMFLEHMDSVGHTNVCMKIWQAFLGNISLIDASISNTFLFKSSVWQAVCRSHGRMWNILSFFYQQMSKVWLSAFINITNIQSWSGTIYHGATFARSSQKQPNNIYHSDV